MLVLVLVVLVLVMLLMMMMKGNFGDAASYLVEKGANANDVYVDESGDRHSLLMDAIIVENVPFAELLVKHGADVNVTDEQGVTTLIQVRRHFRLTYSNNEIKSFLQCCSRCGVRFCSQ